MSPSTSSILFIPGWGATDQAWEVIRNHLPDTRHHVLGWADLLRDEAALAALLAGEPEPPLVVGWSLGALLALRAALETSTRLRGLILISGTARFCSEGPYPGADPRALRAMRARLKREPEQVLGDFAERCAAPDGDAECRARQLAQARHFSTAELTLGLEALATLDLRAGAESLSIPALLVHGADDAIVPLASARELAARAPGARLEVLEGRGHNLPLTAPAEIARLIRSFMT